MTEQRPEYLRPALICGAVAGILSGLPFIGIGNCVCCLWIVGGAATASRLLAKTTGGVLAASDGAIVGALTGIVAAVADALIAIPLRQFNMELARRIMAWFSNFGYEMPSGLGGLFDSGTAVPSPGWFLFSLFVSAAVFTVMGILGGIIGVAVFAKKKPGAPPPAAPPAATLGPGDAA